MGLTERHWFENEEPELTDRQLEDAVYDRLKEQEAEISNYKEMNELKPCPFCGREVRIERYVEEIDYDICWIEHIEKEPICFLHSDRGYVGKQKDLIELWNRRET